MAQLWDNVSYELDEDWDFSLGPLNLQDYTTDKARTGARSLELWTNFGFADPDNDNGIAFQLPNANLVVGNSYTVAAWVNASGARPTTSWSHYIEAFWIDALGAEQIISAADATTFPAGDTWTYHVFGSFVADAAQPKVGFRTEGLGGPAVQSKVFYLDDAALTGVAEQLVAIELGERIIRELVSYYQTDFPVQIAAVDAARADGISLDVPDNSNYFDHERLEGIPSGEGPLVFLEFFEGDFDFSNPYTDVDAGRATYEIPVVVRLTYYNEKGTPMGDVEKRKRRYSVALTEVPRQSPRLAGTDPSVLSVVPGRVEYDREDVGSGIRKTSISCPLLCKLEEV